MEIELKKSNGPFNLEHTLNCGQLFRWKKIGEWWYGIVSEQIIKIKQNSNRLIFHFFPENSNKKFIEEYLRLDDDLHNILSKLSKDEYMNRAITLFSGLRISRQDPWECLISYICATYKSIPGIRKMINDLSKKFGKKINYDGLDFYTFPNPNDITQATLKELRSCGLGFRATRILDTSKIINEGHLSLPTLKYFKYCDAKRELLNLPGVGQKVADCVLLFSLEKLEAFPIDVWIKRAIVNIYSNEFETSFIKKISNKNSITPKEYERIGSFARDYFGNFAGYAQEYLFHLLRIQKNFK